MNGYRSTQTATHWGVFNVETDQEGQIVGVTPFAPDPNPTPISWSLPEQVRSPLRIDRPYVRKAFLKRRERSRGTRGQDEFVAVSWDAALNLIELEMRRIKDEHGNTSIYGGSYGWASAGRLHHSPSVLKRFLGLFGGYVDKLGNHSFGAALHIMPYVMGRGDVPNLMATWPDIVHSTRLVVMFGGAHPKNTQIDSGGLATHEQKGWFAQALRAGVRFINVSPSRKDAEHLSAEWLPIRPGTDTALMMGIGHTLIVENLHDRGFLAGYCVGYENLERYLLGRDDGVAKDAKWAGRITNVDADRIRSLAREMAGTRTLVTTTWSIQRAEHGEQPIWMTVALACLLGQIGLAGGGFGLGLAAVNGIGVPRQTNLPRPTLGLGPNPVKSHVPVGRVTDMLLNPGMNIDYNGRSIELPDIRLIYSVGGNPFHHNTNLNRFVKAWQRPDMVVVHEPWWTPPAKFADIVLPATTTLERNDIQAADMSRHYIAMRKVIEPVGSSRNDFDVFAELSSRFGFGTEYTEGRNEMGWLRHMYDGAKATAEQRGYVLPSFDEFWREGAFEFPRPDEAPTFMADFREDPKANPLKTPSGKLEIYSEAVASFGYSDCLGHPAWLEPAEWLGSTKARDFPFHLLSNQPSGKLHSQLDSSSLSQSTKVNGREVLSMNVRDAESRGLVDGGVVRVFNDRGAFLASLGVVDWLAPGVLQIPTGAWYDPIAPGESGALEKHGNPNVVTDDRGTSRLSQMSIAQSVLVDVEAMIDAPEVTAFDLPQGATSLADAESADTV